MFSYRHGFHAGNHADVLKHTVLVQLLHHMAQKDKAFWVIDTHAGGGLYDLAAGYATKSGEAEAGIHKVWAHRKDADLPAALKDLIAQIQVRTFAGTRARLNWRRRWCGRAITFGCTSCIPRRVASWQGTLPMSSAA
jgi:23S rRNA A2030 N6-methylase RlmJ